MTTPASFDEMKRAYLRIFLSLIALTALTFAVSTVHLGSVGNIVLGLLIAISKASLVASIFMHLKFDNRRLRLFVYVPLGFFLILVLSLTELGL